MDSPLPFDKPTQDRSTGTFQSYFNLSLAYLPPGTDTTPINANQNPNKAQNLLKPLRLFGNKKAITSFKEGLSFFDKKNRCKVLFQATSKPDIGKNKTRNHSVEDSPLNITDSFQYRAEPLIDDKELVLDITQDKNLAKKVEELDIVLGLWLGNKKRNSTQLVKSIPKMRRKSDTSNWSGGMSALEKRTFFWTYEYVAKPVESLRPSFRKDTENSNKKSDFSPRASAKKNTQNRLKQWSKMALEMTKEGKDEISFDKESPYLAVKNQKGTNHTIYLGSNVALENGPQEYAKIKIWGSSKNSVGSQDDELEIAKSKTCVASPILKSRSPKHLKLPEQPSFNRNTSIMSREPLQFNELQKKKVAEVPEGFKSLKPTRTNSHSSFLTMKQSSSLKNSLVGDKPGHQPRSKGHRRELSSELMTSKDDALVTSNEENPLRAASNEKKKSHSKSRSLSKKTEKSKVFLKLKETLINKVYNHSNDNMFFQATTVKSVSKEERRPQVKSPPPRGYITISPQMRLPKLNPDQGPVIHGSVKGHLERNRLKSVVSGTHGTFKGKMSVPNLLMSPSSKISLLNVSRTEKSNGKLDQSRLNMSEAKVLL